MSTITSVRSQEGAQTSIEVAVSESCEQLTGKYFSDCKVVQCSSVAQDPDLANDLWNKSSELVQLDQRLPEEYII